MLTKDTKIDNNSTNNKKKTLFLCEQDWWIESNNFFLDALSLKDREQIDCIPFSDLAFVKDQIAKKTQNNGAYNTIILFAHGLKSGSDHYFTIDPSRKSINILRELQDLSQAQSAIVSSCFANKSFIEDYTEKMKENEMLANLNSGRARRKVVIETSCQMLLALLAEYSLIY